MVFSLKYLGMTLVERPKGEELSAAAVKRIVATAKASGKKLQKVTLKVSPRGIILTDHLTNQLIENVSIYRISYCTADKMHDKVFAYIAQSQHSESLECHAFLCTKRKMAQAVTLTVAQAFKVAFEFWQVSKEEKEKREKANQEGDVPGTRRDSTPSLKSMVATGNLLDLEEMAKAPLSTVSANTNMDETLRPQALSNNSVVWELDDGLDEAFSRPRLASCLLILTITCVISSRPRPLEMTWSEASPDWRSHGQTLRSWTLGCRRRISTMHSACRPLTGTSLTVVASSKMTSSASEGLGPAGHNWPLHMTDQSHLQQSSQLQELSAASDRQQWSLQMRAAWSSRGERAERRLEYQSVSPGLCSEARFASGAQCAGQGPTSCFFLEPVPLLLWEPDSDQSIPCPSSLGIGFPWDIPTPH
ncbi:low density lipoprotein receptor adapter protein 1 isoform X2 [Nannospalax galili]|nr:low density lipoprotein receptor adapter protein 1 isoform X2 [Nannospalax galili]XP_029414088.1 low density lipoprotein receptor adapter protein 1 isoform X2 [Nannospalax galili]